MKKLQVLSVVLLSFISLSIFAELSPAGKWLTIDDKTNKPRSIVQIYTEKNEYFAKILKVFPQPGDTGICHNCPGELKGKPIENLTFMWNVKPTGNNEWGEGRILDPKNGKLYRVKLSLSPDGKTLKVRGYIGISLLGRTQEWIRQR